MWWQYFLVFIGALLVDVFPLPLPPAFTIMIFLQIRFNLDIWLVLFIGVAGSVLGRFILTLYIQFFSTKVFSEVKNLDIQFLGNKMNERGLKGQLFIFVYSLMPLPTTPLFIAGGMARIKSAFIIPPFIFGKLISDMVAVMLGKYAADNTSALVSGFISWKSISGLILGVLFVFILIFIDWHSLLIRKKLVLNFNVFGRDVPKSGIR